jgi:hypothetical protein
MRPWLPLLALFLGGAASGQPAVKLLLHPN